MKILYTKKKKYLDPGGARAPFALCLGPSLLEMESDTILSILSEMEEEEEGATS